MRQDKQQKENIRFILYVICIIGLLGCIAWFVYYFVSLRNSSRQMDEIMDYFVETPQSPELEDKSEAPKAEETPQPSEAEEPAEPEFVLFGDREYPGTADYDVPELHIDFAGLQENNPDVYAWLYVPDTNINYPVLQKDDDPEYYLTHDIEKRSSTPGSIFTQYYNSTDWTDNHTVIYGHNMRDKSMFATLHNYEDTQFFEEHPYIYIYTPEYTFVYQVFGAYEYSDVHLLLGLCNMNNRESFAQYLESVFKLDGMKAIIDRSIDVTADDRIITLSTCVSNSSAHRYLVQAKLTAVGSTSDAGEAADDGENAGTA